MVTGCRALVAITRVLVLEVETSVGDEVGGEAGPNSFVSTTNVATWSALLARRRSAADTGLVTAPVDKGVSGTWAWSEAPSKKQAKAVEKIVFIGLCGLI